MQLQMLYDQNTNQNKELLHAYALTPNKISISPVTNSFSVTFSVLYSSLLASHLLIWHWNSEEKTIHFSCLHCSVQKL